ncbi:histidine phosphatase family protein [Acinetobacter bohemicus]|uniref:histidine phosphatase family protein n=1 Tax=Acinetobacter TaxID=469 RepID=UPI00157D7BF3|nr:MULTISPECIES: histidine phosphatase family protein [Acinetobacter]MCO8041772.1 histidine phosphatase family protein [Acinetobacter sp. S4400-12]MCU7223789.1 histidine phosphatase family protein [Acinetobacter bohemicus]MDM1781805.1 histidine phosphatase family protein [Acinetobacter indicus]QKQ69820.1 histidine phosphatase family protein [Acinetobacter sp. 10FS3-1]
MSLKLLPPSMLSAIDLLPDGQTPVTLFTRHSIRENVQGQGLAGYDLQLTEQGRELAQEWGAYLADRTDRIIQHCISSPIQRCIDTAALMIEGADGVTAEPNTHRIEIIEQGLLVEPGSFVLDIQQAGPYFAKQGALGFINSFVNNALPGMKHPIRGVVDVLELIYNTHPQNKYGVSLAVSHDTILAAMIAVMSGRQEVSREDWPEMMEGLFVWFEGDVFLESKLKWIWRGKVSELNIQDFKNLNL